MVLVVYNTYCTNKKHITNAGIDTLWIQQWEGLRKVHGDKVDPRAQHMEDLCELIQQEREAADISMVWGNLNEDYSDKEIGGMKLLEQVHGLVQIYSHFHGKIPSLEETTEDFSIALCPNHYAHTSTK